jgi:invasion protein IalB
MVKARRCEKNVANQKSHWSGTGAASRFAAMSAWNTDKLESARRGALCRRAERLGAVALLAVLAAALVAVLGMGTPVAYAQQSQEAPEGAAPQQQGAPQDRGGAPLELTEERFQDWMVRCGRPNEQGPEVCEMQQEQIDREDRTIMAVAVGKVPGTSEVGLLILLPLGILLPAGVTMQIDGGAAIPLQVERCERQGCRIERILEPDLLNRLKGGTKATVYFEAVDPQGERQRLGVPISLLGFTAALNEVTG